MFRSIFKRIPCVLHGIFFLLLVNLAAAARAEERSVSFVNDVVPVLTKAGCNVGVCHAKAGGGQKGFQLSLLGFEPQEDFEHLVLEGRGRRLSSGDVDQSLLLLKATGKLPHGGGVRLSPDSEGYALLRGWIAQGARFNSSDPQLISFEIQPQRGTVPMRSERQLTALARYSDGSQRDVTNLALYESNDPAMAEATGAGRVKVLELSGKVSVMVRYQGRIAVFSAAVPLGAPVENLPAERNFVDQHVFANLRELGIPASPVCDDDLILVSARENAPRAIASARFYGRATIDGQVVERPGRLASVAWPVPDASSEIPSPRLLADVPVSVSGFDFAPLTLAPAAAGVVEATAGEKITIPLVLTRRTEFSGATMQVRTMGAGFERVPAFDISLTADNSQAVLDLAALKTPPGDYLISFYGGAVAKYRHYPAAVAVAEVAKKKAEQDAAVVEAEAKKLLEAAKAAPAEKKEEMEKTVQAMEARKKAAAATLTAAAEQVKRAIESAQPKDIVDIVVSEPISIRVKPAEKK